VTDGIIEFSAMRASPLDDPSMCTLPEGAPIRRPYWRSHSRTVWRRSRWSRSGWWVFDVQPVLGDEVAHHVVVHSGLTDTVGLPYLNHRRLVGPHGIIAPASGRFLRTVLL
jgi:hypothetical protein